MHRGRLLRRLEQKRENLSDGRLSAWEHIWISLLGSLISCLTFDQDVSNIIKKLGENPNLRRGTWRSFLNLFIFIWMQMSYVNFELNLSHTLIEGQSYMCVRYYLFSSYRVRKGPKFNNVIDNNFFNPVDLVESPSYISNLSLIFIISSHV